MNSPAKRPLALLHGWGLDSRVWEALLPHLTPHFSVTRLQLPGYPGRPDGADSVAATVDALLADVPEGALLLGWSLGGQLAQLMAARAPKRIAGLVLVATSPRFLAGNGWNAGQPASLLGGFSAAVGLAPGPVLPRFATLMNQGDSLAKDINRQLAPLTKAPLAEKAALLRGLDWLRDLDLRPLALWAGLLPQASFLRIHRTAIVNLRHVQGLDRSAGDRWRVAFRQLDETWPVSRPHRQELRQRLGI